MEIFDNLKVNIKKDNTFRTKAKALADTICKFKFIVSLVTWQNILNEANVTDKILEKENFHIYLAIKEL